MRLIVSCTSCTLQYDARGRSPGTRFRCRCGYVLVVTLPEGHDASVIRCSSCGGARTPGQKACGYCHASFTIHERDLHTICPSCLTRISDKARFCHHCAQSISPERSAGEATDWACPVCGDEHTLNHKSLGEGMAGLLECHQCAGLWMGPNAFQSLETEAASEGRSKGAAVKTGPAGGPYPGGPSPLKQQGPIYRKCPECSTIMNRTNYGRMSGIIIDVCGDHGIWFDAHELDTILRWVREGGLETAATKLHLKKAEQLRRLKGEARAQAAAARFNPTVDSRSRRGGVEVHTLVDVVELVVSGLGTLLRW